MEGKMLRYFISFDGLFSSCEHSHWFESIYIGFSLAVGQTALVRMTALESCFHHLWTGVVFASPFPASCYENTRCYSLSCWSRC